MKMRKIVVGLSGLLFMVSSFLSFLTADHCYFLWAANSQFLADKHASKGITCDGCHKENPPKVLVPTEPCLQCHGGNYEKLAETTKKLDPNPHASHRGDLSCESCHHAHKASVNYCGACHDFNFNVP